MKKRIVVVDGYNVIHSSSSLKSSLARNVFRAQNQLIRMVCRYCSLAQVKGYVVFDAYRREASAAFEESISSLVKVVYTGKGETADSYIEKFIAENKNNPQYSYIYVVTSDYSQGTTVLDEHILPLSPENFLQEMESSGKNIQKRYSQRTPFSYPLLSSELRRKILDRIRKKREG